MIATLASNGVGVRVLASLAGHRSIATTQAYIDVNDDQKRAAVELVGLRAATRYPRTPINKRLPSLNPASHAHSQTL